MIIKHITPDLSLSENLAIVGSSAKLAESKLGKEIDSFDDVLRFNRAPTEGYEEIAGSKTTVRIVNGHVFMSVPFTRWEEDETFVKRLRNTKLIIARGPELVARRNEAVHPSIELYVAKHFDVEGVTLPTVGLLGILLAVKSGIRPVVYGWSTSADEPMSHYFNKRSPTTSNCHKWEAELRLINSLRQEDKIEIRA